MTGEEMERAVEFLLQSQATLEERIEQVNKNLSEQVAETNRIVQLMAASQSWFNEMMTMTIGALADGQQKLADSQRELGESPKHTDRKLDALIDIVRERFGGKGGGSGV